MTEALGITAVWRNGGFSASYDSFVGKQTVVLRINIFGEIPPLRQAANRYMELIPKTFQLTKIDYNKQWKME